MKFTTRHLFLLTLFIALLIPAVIGVRTYLNPPPPSHAAQSLSQLNDWDADELYLYNNPEIARHKNYIVSGESNAHIETLLEILAEYGHPAEWDNSNRKYRFK